LLLPLYVTGLSGYHHAKTPYWHLRHTGLPLLGWHCDAGMLLSFAGHFIVDALSVVGAGLKPP
jgi:hypothetical protein